MDNGDVITAPPGRESAEYLDHLEMRVRRLEETVAQLQDTQALEERVVERVASRARPVAEPAPAAPRPEPPRPAETAPPVVATPVVTAPPSSPLTLLGLLLDTFGEMRSMIAMYVDRRYRMRWTGYLLPPLLLIAIVTSILWFPGLSWVFNFNALVACLLNVPVVLFLGYFWYRLLTWEAKRYRDTVATLPPAPRY